MTDSPSDAEGVLTHAVDVGEIRRLTLFFADLVDSTALSTQVEPRRIAWSSGDTANRWCAS